MKTAKSAKTDADKKLTSTIKSTKSSDKSAVAVKNKSAKEEKKGNNKDVKRGKSSEKTKPIDKKGKKLD